MPPDTPTAQTAAKVVVRLERPALERLYDPAPEPVIVLEPVHGYLRYCNQSFMDLCGLRPRTVRRFIDNGGRLSEIFKLDQTSDLPSLVHRAAKLDQSLGASSVRGRVLGGPRHDLVVTLTAAPIDAFDDCGPAVLLTLRDTTAEHRMQTKYHRLLAAKRRRAEELESRVRQRTRELAETQEELLHATRLAAVGEVAGAAAHEVLNPLTAIVGNLDHLQDGLDDEAATLDALRRTIDGAANPTVALRRISMELREDLARRRRVLNVVCNASRRIERIIQGMLGVSSAQPIPEALRLSQVLREVRDLMAYSFDRAGVALDIQVDTHLLVYADRGELLQVLTNLIRNGCQAAYQAHGGRGGRVRTSATATAQIATIQVEDNGVGVPEEVQDRIFDTGFTTKPRSEGSGLGLPISRRLMRRNGGDLVLHTSNPDTGTTMRVTLPLKDHL